MQHASRATAIPEAVARVAANTARDIGASYILAFTESGWSARNVSLAPPRCRSLPFSPNARTLRRNALYWGVLPREVPHITDDDRLVDACTADPLASGLASPGERIVVVFGAPMGISGSRNTIRVHVVG